LPFSLVTALFETGDLFLKMTTQDERIKKLEDTIVGLEARIHLLESYIARQEKDTSDFLIKINEETRKHEREERRQARPLGPPPEGCKQQ
jgi:chaperonin cofactor prefoldin